MDVDILLDLVAEDKYLHGIVYNVDAIRTKLLFTPNRFTLSKNKKKALHLDSQVIL